MPSGGTTDELSLKAVQLGYCKEDLTRSTAEGVGGLGLHAKVPEAYEVNRKCPVKVGKKRIAVSAGFHTCFSGFFSEYEDVNVFELLCCTSHQNGGIQL